MRRGVQPAQKRLFVIDGSKALRAAIRAVFGAEQPVQRCRAHKLRNVLDRLPEPERDQVRAAMRAAWRLDPKTGRAKLEKLALWLERDCPAAAASLREGLEEMFHHQPAGASGFAASLSGHHQSHRESAGGSEVANSPGVPLAGCGHGPALGRLQLPGHGEKLPPPDGVLGPVDVESDPRRIKVGHSTERWRSMMAPNRRYELSTEFRTPSGG